MAWNFCHINQLDFFDQSIIMMNFFVYIETFISRLYYLFIY